MARTPKRRPEFRQWVDALPAAQWSDMPLTHITKGVVARDIIREGEIEPDDCPVMKHPASYFFYGRPAYRVGGDGAIKTEAACPFCFVFAPDITAMAKNAYAFDTGAFHARMYKHAIMEEMRIDDFALDGDPDRIRKLISAVFGTREAYLEGRPVSASQRESLSGPSDFLASAYLSLVASDGRNEPDDRVGSIEVVFNEVVKTKGNLIALVVPHTIWEGADKAEWLLALKDSGVDIRTYSFAPGRGPDYYFALIEAEVRSIYKSMGFL